MRELTPDNTWSYVRESGWVSGSSGRAEALAWGVSNVVLRVSSDAGPDIVVKQSRERLRTPAEWVSRLDRIWREADVMREIAPLLPPGVVPRVLHEDRENYLFLMDAAPVDHVVWKQSLLQGQADTGIAERLGTYLATIHRQTAGRDDFRERWGDREVFVQLRVDPFYHRVADQHADVRPAIEQMIDEMWETSVCLVHADFSPKNVLISSAGITLVDFETAHFGDPAFDLGFFLSHLLLKTILHADRFDEFAALTKLFWRGYLGTLNSIPDPAAPAESFPPGRELPPNHTRTTPVLPLPIAMRSLAAIWPKAVKQALAGPALLRRTIPHLASCMWARIDGTSRIDYLQPDWQRQAVRNICRDLLLRGARTWTDVLERLRQHENFQRLGEKTQ
ncbi:MAG: aminoglycoside phosphotransferase family protein [Planctomycetales bacterium]|nr:aminoglycoside phosphotransferase family protein [Planctomycetales bacterium]